MDDQNKCIYRNRRAVFWATTTIWKKAKKLKVIILVINCDAILFYIFVLQSYSLTFNKTQTTSGHFQMYIQINQYTKERHKLNFVAGVLNNIHPVIKYKIFASNTYSNFIPQVIAPTLCSVGGNRGLIRTRIRATRRKIH